MLVLLTFISCKKDKKNPEETPAPIVCNYQTTGLAIGKYVSMVNSSTQLDTVIVSFVKDNCPDTTYEYQIKGISQAFNDWGAALVNAYSVHIINISDKDNYGESFDLKIKTGPNGIMVSGYSNYFNPTAFSTYLSFKKIQ